LVHTDYDNFSRIYDLVYDFTDDVDFYLRLAKRFPGRVLEIGCGSGRITLPLARAGLEVTGIDNSSNMLELAREKLAREDDPVRQRVELVFADVRELDLGRRFNLIIYPFNSFMYLYTPEDQVRALKRIRAHLQDDGLVALALFVPNQGVTSYLPGVPQFLWSKKHPEGGDILCWEVKEVDTFYQIARTKLILDWLKPDGEHKRYLQEQTFRYFTFYEFNHLLERRGFNVVKVLGDFTDEPLGPQHSDMVFLAEKNVNWRE